MRPSGTDDASDHHAQGPLADTPHATRCEARGGRPHLGVAAADDAHGTEVAGGRDGISDASSVTGAERATDPERPADANDTANAERAADAKCAAGPKHPTDAGDPARGRMRRLNALLERCRTQDASAVRVEKLPSRAGAFRANLKHAYLALVAQPHHEAAASTPCPPRIRPYAAFV